MNNIVKIDDLNEYITEQTKEYIVYCIPLLVNPDLEHLRENYRDGVITRRMSHNDNQLYLRGIPCESITEFKLYYK